MKATTTFPKVSTNASEMMNDTQMRAFISQFKIFLCQTYALLAQTQGCHWNYTGTNFPGIHTLLETQYEFIFKQIDKLAERLRALNVFAPATLSEIYEIASKRDLSEYDSSLYDQIDRLLVSHKVLKKDAEELIERAETCKDYVSQDMLVAQLEFHDKAVWMLNSARDF